MTDEREVDRQEQGQGPSSEQPAGAAAPYLETGEERYRRLIGLLPVAIYTCQAPSGVITFYNARAAELWGQAPRLGDTEQRFCGSFRLWSPDGTLLPPDQAPMALALGEGREFRNQEVIIERPDGTRITVLVNIDPIRDSRGQVAGAINVFHDTTALKQAQESKARLAAIVESSDDAIISKDLNGVILSWNAGAQRLFGYAAQEVIGQSITILIPPDRFDEEPGILERIRRGEPINHYETIRRRKDGALLDISLTVSPIMDAHGKVVGASKIARDISERKRIEQALQEADRRKNEFLATLAHELRNPLAPIRNSLNILRMTGGDAPASERVLEMMERQINHMVRLVDDLLEVSRITTGKIDLRMEPVQIASVIRSAIETSKPLIDAAGHHLAATLPPEPLTVDADPVRLSQVVANLLNNAAKYTEPGGQIWITARADQGQVAISVRDSGIGISAEMLPHVFEMFTQAHQDHRRSQDGLGIGLALVKRLVQMHGGRVEVASLGEGHGSEFTIRLPLSQVQLPAADRAALGDDVHRQSARQRILVVDDHQDAALSLGMLLTILGSDVRTAHDGESALEALETYQPSVVLLDLGMPGMSGYEVARRMRELPSFENVMLVALTGWGQEEDRRRTREAGFDHHLVKPVNVESLQVLLASVQDRKPRTRPLTGGGAG